jgi:hypothetical protein
MPELPRPEGDPTVLPSSLQAREAWDTKAEDTIVLHVAPLVYWTRVGGAAGGCLARAFLGTARPAQGGLPAQTLSCVTAPVGHPCTTRDWHY